MPAWRASTAATPTSRPRITSELSGSGHPTTGTGAPTITIDCKKPTGAACNATATTYDALAESGSTAIVTISYNYNWITPVISSMFGVDTTLTPEHPDEGRVIRPGLRLRRRRRDEYGVVAILVAVLAMVLLMFAAYAVDIGMQVNRKHQLNDTLDAAAQAGAYRLPGSAIAAKADALAFAAAHDPTETGSLVPNVDFWCVVASKLSNGSYGVDTTQIPATCNPGTSPYTAGATYKATGRVITCSPVLCAIPCVEPVPNNGTPPIACNTIRVYQGRDVPFAFAPAGGIDKGGTGNVISVACKRLLRHGRAQPDGRRGGRRPHRAACATTDVADMVAGIKGMLTADDAQPAVRRPRHDRPAAPRDHRQPSPAAHAREPVHGTTTLGPWLPIPFSQQLPRRAHRDQRPSTLVKGVDCLPGQLRPGRPSRRR